MIFAFVTYVFAQLTSSGDVLAPSPEISQILSTDSLGWMLAASFLILVLIVGAYYVGFRSGQRQANPSHSGGEPMVESGGPLRFGGYSNDSWRLVALLNPSCANGLASSEQHTITPLPELAEELLVSSCSSLSDFRLARTSFRLAPAKLFTKRVLPSERPIN
jgi:hypothetical protein